MGEVVETFNDGEIQYEFLVGSTGLVNTDRSDTGVHDDDRCGCTHNNFFFSGLTGHIQFLC